MTIAEGVVVMKRRLNGIWRLTRFTEYVSFVLFTTFLGAAAGGGVWGWRLITVLAANWLAVGFAFMINDVEDAPDDAINPAKMLRNPVSSGDISTRSARLSSFAAAIAAAVLYAWLGWWPFLVGVSCLTLAFLYSSRDVRLKAIPVADLVSHALMLAGLQFLAAYMTFEGGPSWQWVFPLAFVSAISLYGQLFNELRDLEGDLKAGVRHTASLVGPRYAHLLMMTWIVIGVASAVVIVFILRMIPTWVLVLMAVAAAVLALRPLLSLRRGATAVELHGPFQKPLEIAGAFALLAWFAFPSVLALLAPWVGPAAQRLTVIIAR
ncbi:MAG TPA: UbiA family prenyltransferase [Anaerolineales bacterium]|nr:UbiA family prenyltransferase [Anaerolineales bacterium]